MLYETLMFLRYNVSLKTIPTRHRVITIGVKFQDCTYAHIIMTYRLYFLYENNSRK